MSRLPAQTGKRDQASGLTPWILMLSVITVAIPSTSTTAERGIEMFNIAAAAHLAELGRRIRTARTKLHWSQEAFAGVCGLERSYYGGVERGKRNVTFKVLCLSCDGLACDVATITQGLPHLIQACLFNRQMDRPATARMLGR